MKGPPESSPRENGSVPAQFSRASDIGRDHPGGRAGTAVLRFVPFRRRGDQGVVPTTSVSRNHRQGSCQQHGSRGRRSPRGEPAARGCCERARPRRTGGPPDARRPRMPESCEGRAPAAVEARRRHPVPEAARGAGGASTSVCVIRGVRISCGGACHARDRRRSQLIVDAGAREGASRARLPGVRSSAAGGRSSRLSGPPARGELSGGPFSFDNNDCG